MAVSVGLCGLVSQVQAEAISVMTFNICISDKKTEEIRLWKTRLPLVAAFLKNNRPDIIGFQEVTAQQLADLKEVLPEYDSFGDFRGTAWFGKGPNESTPIFYKKGKFERVAYGTFALNQWPDWWGMPIRHEDCCRVFVPGVPLELKAIQKVRFFMW